MVSSGSLGCLNNFSPEVFHHVIIKHSGVKIA